MASNVPDPITPVAAHSSAAAFVKSPPSASPPGHRSNGLVSRQSVLAAGSFGLAFSGLPASNSAHARPIPHLGDPKGL